MQSNNDFRRAAKSMGVSLWRIALEIGISEPTMTRWLRVPLSEEKRGIIANALKNIGGEHDGTAKN